MDLEHRLADALHEVTDAEPPDDLVPRTLARLPVQPVRREARTRSLFAPVAAMLGGLVLVVLAIALLSGGGLLPPGDDPTPGDVAAASPSPLTATGPATPSVLPTASEPATPSPSSPVSVIPLCEDVARIEAAPELYGRSPIYAANEQPTEELQRWARGKPGFEELWIDREHLGWVTLAFSRDAEQRQAELEEEFPGVGAVVVGVDWTMAELEALQQRVVDELPPGTWSATGISVTQGVVMIGLGYLRPEKVAAVERVFAGERVCIEGADPALAPEPGAQPQAGDGWRLLADEKDVGASYRTGIAFDEASYEALWREIGLRGDRPPVDFESEVVIWFGQVFSGSCPDIRLDDVVVDHDRALVFTDMTWLHEGGACSGDANPHAYVVAVQRSKLPTGPFAIQLDAADPPAGVPEERTVVDVDLSQPGAVAGPGDVHGDPALPGPDIDGPGMIVEPGYPGLYRAPVHCGIEWLGPINGLYWRTDAPSSGGYIPPEWRVQVDEDETLVLSVTITTDPEPSLTATANGHTLVYRASPEQPPACV